MVNVLSNKTKRDALTPGDHIYSYRMLKSYSHHGIYIGNDKVIHYTDGNNAVANGLVQGTLPGATSSAGSTKSFANSSAKDEEMKDCKQCSKFQHGRPKDGVILSCLDCFLCGGKLYLFAYSVSRFFFYAKVRGGTCTLAPSDPSDEVLHRAQYLLDHGFGAYNLLKHNCEDFAMYCKTGLLTPSLKSAAISGQAIGFAASTAASRGSVDTKNLLASINVYFDGRYQSDIGVRQDLVKIPVEEFVRNAKDQEGTTSQKNQP